MYHEVVVEVQSQDQVEGEAHCDLDLAVEGEDLQEQEKVPLAEVKQVLGVEGEEALEV